ncbi:uncharacterized protein LOC113796934 isoform X2 [Dermatophagoides pteronyssinus]|uniref:uncharacterized protein LOC113796934 isoform X2 n=1 Tax=Dermatophagoides pteronyssinus TaxID=6956 RepID=UPI003F6800D0
MFVILILMISSVPSLFLIGTINAIGSIPSSSLTLSRTTTHNSDNNDDKNQSSNATSTVYFHQYLPNNNNNNDSQQQQQEQQSSPPSTTAKELNLNSSESRNFYNSYDPWTLDDPNIKHYPPIPMDIVRNNPRDDDDNDGQAGDYDDDNDDIDNDDEQRQSPTNDNQGDGTEHDNGQDDNDFDIPWNNDDTSEFDQDNSASFNIPSRVEALKGCKTVYKEISASLPGQSATTNGNNVMSDDEFRRRRKKRSLDNDDDDDNDGKLAAAAAAKRGSYIMTRECHFIDGDKNKQKINPTTTTKTSSNIHQQGTNTGESRFIPINADYPRYPRNGIMMKSIPQHQYHHHNNNPFSHNHLYYNNHHHDSRQTPSPTSSAFSNSDDNDSGVGGSSGILSSSRRRRTPNYLESNRVDPFSFQSERRPINSYGDSKYKFRHTSAADSNVPSSNGGGGNKGITKRYSTRFNYFHQQPTKKTNLIPARNYDHGQTAIPDSNAVNLGSSEFNDENVNDLGNDDAPDDPDDTDPEDLLLHNDVNDFASSSSLSTPTKIHGQRRLLLADDDGFGDGYDDGGDDHSGGGGGGGGEANNDDDDYSDHDDHGGQGDNSDGGGGGSADYDGDDGGQGDDYSGDYD